MGPLILALIAVGSHGSAAEPERPLVSHVTVGVRDLEIALKTWRDEFGFEIVARRDGPDATLGKLWGIEPARIRRQALVGTPGLSKARVHLVEFDRPDPPVREGARATDFGPKNLDVACRDLPKKYEALLQKGQTFRSPWVEYPFEGKQVREVQMPGHDETNLVLVEIVGDPAPWSDQGCAGLTSFVAVSPDPDADQRFFTEVLGFELGGSHLLKGSEIETMVGLPKGAGLDMRLFGPKDDVYGRVEIVHYQGVAGTNRFARARPPALGTLHVTLFVLDLARVLEAARAHGSSVQAHGVIETIYGQGRAATVFAPNGLRVELMEQR